MHQELGLCRLVSDGNLDVLEVCAAHFKSGAANLEAFRRRSWGTGSGCARLNTFRSHGWQRRCERPNFHARIPGRRSKSRGRSRRNSRRTSSVGLCRLHAKGQRRDCAFPIQAISLAGAIDIGRSIDNGATTAKVGLGTGRLASVFGNSIGVRVYHIPPPFHTRTHVNE